MNFSEALHAVKHGAHIQRKGWNAKNMWVFYVPLEAAQIPHKIGGGYPVQAFLMIKDADDKIVPWLISQTDALADDWEAVMPPGRLHSEPLILNRIAGADHE